MKNVEKRERIVVIEWEELKEKGLRKSDMKMVDMGGVKKRIVERIGKEKRNKVMKSLIEEIVVYEENMVLEEKNEKSVVERIGGIEIEENRILKEDESIESDEEMRIEKSGDIEEKGRDEGKIKG